MLMMSGVNKQKLFNTVSGEPVEICKSGKEADSVALRKAKRWIDQHR